MDDDDLDAELCTTDSPTSIRRRVVPTVLVVGCSRWFMTRCREALAMSGAAVEECGIESYKPVATRLWPPVIVMTEALNAFDPEGFSEIALALGSTLLMVESEEIATDDLNARLVQAVFKAMPRQESFER